MLQILKSFFRGVGRILWMCTRYLLVCGLAMYVMIALATGKFPPPVFELYKNLQSMHSAMDLVQATSKIAMAHNQQKQIMADIDSGARSDNFQASATLPPDAQLQKIKALEYEVAVLKAKLARAQWETRQAQQQQQHPTQPMQRQTASSQP